MVKKQKIDTDNPTSNVISQIKLKKNIIISLSGIGIVGIILRLYYLPYEIPIELDAINYLAYSYFLSQNYQFPIADLPNNGWPTFLSIFFMSINSSNFFDLVITQRLVAISLSVCTIIPIYLICKEYFDYRIALCGAAIFCFEPRIIINSILGVAEPLYIFLGSLTLALVLNKNQKLDYVAFSVAALFSLVRYEGILILIPLSIFLLLRNRKEKKIIFKYFILISIFLITLSPMITIRMDTMGYDGILYNFYWNANFVSDKIIQGEIDPDDLIYDGSVEKNNPLFFLSFAIENYIKYFGLISIPIFIFLIPLTLIYILKNKVWKKLNRKVLLVISFIAIMSIPALFAYGRGIQETRYLYILYPMLCVVSLYGVNQIFEKVSKKRILFLILFLSIIFSSIMFLEYKKIDYEHTKEVFEISKKIVETTDNINSNAIDGSYLTIISFMNRLESQAPIYESGKLLTEFTKVSVDTPLDSYNSLDDIIKSDKLTHIALDGNNMPSFFNDVFYNEKKYEYLKKVFDSKDNGYKYHVKIFEIDYDIYHENKKLDKND